MNYKLWISILTIFTLLAVSAQTQIPAKDQYFGQKPPGMVAEVFAPDIISTNANEHSAPAFSPDGTKVVWAISNRGTYLVEMKYENGAWSKPSRPSFTDSLANTDVYPSFSANGKKLYFSSNRKMPAGFPQDGNNRIWQVELTSTGWGTPVPFDTAASRGQDFANAMANNGNLYFSSSIRKGTGWNIRVAKKINGVYKQPELLPFNINSTGYEDGAFIAPDESYLIFESSRADAPNGQTSLFISFKNKKGQWTVPMSMGPQINSGMGERFARLSPDGKFLFFGSYRNQSPGKVGADIYWIDAKIIDELKKSSAAKKFIDKKVGDKILAAIDNNEINLASELLEKWCSTYPNNLEAKVTFSSMLRLQKRFAEAEKLFSNEASIPQNNPKIILEKVLISYGLQQNQIAETLFAPLLADKPEIRNRYNFLADELFKMADYKLSDEYFEKAMAIRSNSPAFYNRACAYALVGEKDRAFALLNTAIEKGFNKKLDYETDADLTSLRQDARWKELLTKLK